MRTFSNARGMMHSNEISFSNQHEKRHSQNVYHTRPRICQKYQIWSIELWAYAMLRNAKQLNSSSLCGIYGNCCVLNLIQLTYTVIAVNGKAVALAILWKRWKCKLFHSFFVVGLFLFRIYAFGHSLVLTDTGSCVYLWVYSSCCSDGSTWFMLFGFSTNG